MNIDQPTASVTVGLSREEVEQRPVAGAVHGRPAGSGRTALQIIRANVATRMNTLLGALFAATLVARSPKDAVFMVIVVINSAVGIVQELRAKRTLDGLSVLDAAPVTVIRSGVEQRIDPSDLVLDDVLVVHRGEVVPVDAVMNDAAGALTLLRVDESQLTGESESVEKHPGDRVLSGSVVVAGQANLLTVAVGDECYVRKLTGQARAFSMTRSELRDGIDSMIRIVTYAMVPTAALLLWSQLSANETMAQAITGTVAGVAAMVTEGLVLMTSVAFAVGASRLARHRVLTRELYAIEGLARVDELFVDKTGTLTEPGMTVASVDLVAAIAGIDIGDLLGAFARAGEPNPTTVAVADRYPVQSDHQIRSVARRTVEFDSARRWSAAELHMTDESAARSDGLSSVLNVVLGAPDVMLEPCERLEAADIAIAERVAMHESEGHRVVLVGLARTFPDQSRPLDVTDLRVLAVVALIEKTKADVATTIEYFADQGVRVTVLSGDSPGTVGTVARTLGLGDGSSTDATDIGEDPLPETVLSASTAPASSVASLRPRSGRSSPPPNTPATPLQ